MTREEELDVRSLASRVRERIYYLALVDIATHYYHGEDDYGDIAREALETADALEAQAGPPPSQTTPASSEPQTAASEAINGDSVDATRATFTYRITAAQLADLRKRGLVTDTQIKS